MLDAAIVPCAENTARLLLRSASIFEGAGLVEAARLNRHAANIIAICVAVLAREPGPKDAPTPYLEMSSD